MLKQRQLTAVAKVTKQARVQDFVRARQWQQLGRAEWEHLRTAMPDISVETLRKSLAAMPVSLEQPFAGVSTKTLTDLEDSLLAMASCYRQDAALGVLCRNEVIWAKDRARFASQNNKADSEKRALKEEMVRWMLVWLGDPALFGPWVTLRKLALTAGRANPPESSPLP